MFRVGVGLLASVFVCACSSSYEPARSPRITTVVEGGTPTFVKDGERYGNPAFGVGLVHAVQGNPRAEEQARIGRNLAIGGVAIDMVGLGSEVAGLVAVDRDTSRPPSDLATGLVVGGAAAVIVGTIMLLSAQPHIYDAVNIYNDGLSSAPR